MSYSKLLNRQIKKCLSSELQQHPEVQRLLQVIDEAYEAYERDAELSARAFKISEEEYVEMNNLLEHELQVKQYSMQKLKETVSVVAGKNSEVISDDLMVVSEILLEQVNKRKNAENVFASLVYNMQSGILLEDSQRKIVLANRLFCEYFCIPAPAEALTGMDCSDSAEQSKHLLKEPDQFVARIATLLNNRQLVTGEILEMADGKILERDYIPIYLDDSYQGHLWKYTDITEKRRVQETIETQRRFYEDILNNIPADIAVFNNRHEYLFVNPNAVKNGDIRKWLIGKTDEQYCAFRNRPLRLAADRNLGLEKVIRMQEESEYEETIVQPDGRSEYFLRKWHPVLNEQNEVSLVIGYGLNITERKKAEEVVRSNEEKYRNIIANMNLGLMEVNMQDEVLFVNHSFCSMSGYEENELLGKKAQQIFVRVDEQQVLSAKRELRKKGISDAYEIEVIIKSGEKRWWFVSGAPLFNHLGEVVGSIGIHLDITDQKKLEAALTDARELAESSAHAKQAFLVNMSHEIRTPMNAILGMGKLLSKTMLDYTQRSYLDSINNAGEHLMVVINDILDISKIEAGKLELELVGFDIRNVIEHAGKVMHHRAEQKSLQIVSAVDERVANVLIGDPHRLNQVLLNLVGNAVKFTEKGNVCIDCRLLEDHTDKQVLSIMVTDEGIGISKDFLDRIFESFSQQDRTISRRYGGTGLGMAISKQLIELMGGSISVNSREQEGTEVQLLLHLKKGESKDLVAENNFVADINILAGKKILLVEDNEMNRMVASIALQHYGAGIKEVENGAEALHVLSSEKFDLVLMDLQMPVMDGLEATMHIRSQLKLDIPVIALTANAVKGEEKKCYAVGMNDFITKPFNEQKLVNIIAGWLGRSEQQCKTPVKNIQTGNLFSIEKLNEICHGNEAFRSKMPRIFINTMPATVNEIKAALKIQDYASVKSLAHRMKPSIDNMGIDCFTNEIREIEKLALAGKSTPRLTELIERLELVIAEVVEELKALL